MPNLLPTPAIPVSLDVALWFLDRARAADTHLAAQKLQDLLFLACLEYERAHDARPLMPAAFVANDIAVCEPNIYRLLEEGRPRARVEPVPPPIESFLADLWARYGHVPVDHLNAIVRRAAAGPDSVPAHSVAAPVAAVTPEPAASGVTPAIAQPAPKRPRQAQHQTQNGRQVTVSQWRPPQAPKTSPPRA